MMTEIKVSKMANILLDIKDLHVERDDKKILKGVNLSIPVGETHAIMGPNGSGKSTLSYVIAGHPHYRVTKGTLYYKGQDLLSMPVDERAKMGIFLGFQYPIEIPGVPINHFLRLAFNASRRHRGDKEMDAFEFLKLLKQLRLQLGISEEMLGRSLNVGFSGGEKKRLEMLQMLLLQPALSILDEADSGLDIDALKIVAETINQHRQPTRSMILITHYQRLLSYVLPDQIHIMANGRIVKSGTKELALMLEEQGYEKVMKMKAGGAA